MKRLARLSSSLLGVVLMALLPAAGVADTGTELARSKQCLACHQVDSKRVGPAFTVVAERYSGAPEALHYLADTIRKGSRQKWGAVPMPAQPHVNQNEAQRIAQWILSLAKEVPAD